MCDSFCEFSYYVYSTCLALEVSKGEGYQKQKAGNKNKKY